LTKFLGIETSTAVCSVALSCDARVVVEYTLELGSHHSERLQPMVEMVLREAGLSVGDLDGVVDHAMSIDGVEVALFFKEQEPGQQRVSLRSRGKVDVNRIARQFDGGGHIRASGCEIKGTVEEVQARLLSVVREQL